MTQSRRAHQPSAETGAQAQPLVGIIMGSDSDLPVMQDTADVLRALGVPYEMTIVSAHRTPRRLYEYAESAVERGLRVIVAGAGGAAHLPGMAAALTPLPVIGVPVKTSSLSGQDSLLSIVQMPAGVPVATVAINGAKNAGILAAQILGASDGQVRERVADYKRELEQMVLGKVAIMERDQHP
ncbi:5-(carboxyamino)imidazole ribonucleotide mutase [Thiocystis violacea]|uniref:5-(carboxyamino)imidazole ribonucleotide mutase n=1 Tax=Thiocystis violacea TaxID=13725 RepID=UPI00190552F1|nr:5-(carboxyamino)imidazole ribonucleotide mutase [Thiocystis violacea]MBK1723310.1 5-(carboxyamino)imidazole ribonucleotide mutase [Thiocystis violacea]